MALTQEPYSYAANNPVNYSDPSGHCAVAVPADTAICVGGVSWLGAAVATGVGAIIGVILAGGGGGSAVPPSATSPATREEYIYQSTYVPVPKGKILPGFPSARPVKGKTPIRGGSGKTRQRWIDGDTGNILEWDYQHGAVEIWDRKGRRHLGECDPETGEYTKPGDPSRRPIER